MTRPPVKVLLIEDSDVEARVIGEVLKGSTAGPFAVVRVETLEKAFAQLAKEGFDAVLLDLLLPGRSGLQSLRELRAKDASTPVIILTGLRDEGLALEAIQAGAQDYLLKGEAGASLLARSIRYAIERRRQDEALQSMFRRMSLAEKLAQIGSWSWDVKADAVWWSEELYRIFGLESSKFGASFAAYLDTIHPEDRDFVRGSIQRSLERGEPFSFQHRIVRPDGAVRHLQCFGEPVKDVAGRVLSLVGSAQDITERRDAEEALKRTEALLSQAQKMEAVGRLAGGVAHDFNNLLTAILGLAELSSKGLDPGSALSQDLLEIKETAMKAARLTQQLLAFSRRQRIEPVDLDLNTLLDSSQKLLRRVIGEDVELAVEDSASGARVRADPGQLEQLIMNMVVNARDAMPNGGRLTLGTSRVVLNEEFVSRNPWAYPGIYSVLSIADNGTGMSPEVLEHLYEPFFTTKELGKGTGLGLATCYGIAKQNGGFIGCESEPGRGTTFRIYLPRIEDKGEVMGRDEPSEDLPRGTETVLVVEDEPHVRRLAVRVLQKLGYKTLEATNGEEGLQAIREDTEGKIGLVITDMVMPRWGGERLFTEISRLRPKLRVIFTSGYADDDGLRKAMDSRGGWFIPKPFTAAVLASTVRRALDSPEPPQR